MCLRARIFRTPSSWLVVAAIAALAGCSSTPATPPKQAVIVAVNDVYRIEGVAGGERGGLARLRTLRADLERTHPDLLLVHGGDVFGPSFLSRSYHGQQMIDVMNLLDGKPGPEGFDSRMFVAFGNHEFDESRCDKPDVIRSRVAESEFTWLASNIDWAACHGQPPMLAPSDHLKTDTIVESGGLRIGLFALLLPFGDVDAPQQPEVRSALDVARAETKKLRGEGAQVVIAVTHLPIAEDLNLEQTLGGDGPDLILGGHDHTAMAEPEAGPRVFKADADAVTADVVTISLGAGGKPVIERRLESLGDAVAKDPAVDQSVQAWMHRHAQEYCAKTKEAPDCLEQVVGRTQTEIEAEELKNRGMETGIGDWIADRMRGARPGADVALLNSGTLRLNYDLPAGSVLQRRHIEELFGFKTPLLVKKITGAQLWSAVDNALRHRGEGGWAHMSGLALAVGPDAHLARLKVRRADGKVDTVTKDSKKTYRIVLSAYVACRGDGYDFGVDLAKFGGDAKQCQAKIKNIVDPKGPEKELSAVVLQAIKDAGDTGIAPQTDSRICEPGQTGCLIDTW